jgi:hypothetical protein
VEDELLTIPIAQAFLNPAGGFGIKEHVAILIMASTATDSALAISVFAAEELYYGITPSYGTAIFTLLGSQCFGYGIAGLMRSFTVYPTYIVRRPRLPATSVDSSSVLMRRAGLPQPDPPSQPLRRSAPRQDCPVAEEAPKVLLARLHRHLRLGSVSLVRPNLAFDLH